VYNGIFNLVDAWQEPNDLRKVFKFKLSFASEIEKVVSDTKADAEPDRLIPSWVKLEVWKRDKGLCSKCGSNQNLHFDHIIPYSRGGSSSDPRNIQILCAKHNLEKRDKIE
jgi:5-methylcytosine-specific restriction endonuclease McrA